MVGVGPRTVPVHSSKKMERMPKQPDPLSRGRGAGRGRVSDRGLPLHLGLSVPKNSKGVSQQSPRLKRASVAPRFYLGFQSNHPHNPESGCASSADPDARRIPSPGGEGRVRASLRHPSARPIHQSITPPIHPFVPHQKPALAKTPASRLICAPCGASNSI
jgi:hypothetical protein